ncbi:hypothetical protein AWB72_05494 [Caballeronia concitans]|uniref:Uncharacterized protein n=1 Tax=Caballeronia concitans TaxID=1777133 RepID=A0A658R5Q7_9BURK|nr:hypothetical protein AWB72_05494 [Caballeronia concitans]
MLAPDALHGRDRHVAELCRKLIAAPVCRAVGGFVLESTVEHTRLKSGWRLLGSAPGMSGVHARQSLAKNAPRPARDEARVATQCAHDAVARFAVLEHQDQLRASYVRRTHRSAARRRQQLLAFGIGQIHFAHDLHLNTLGVPIQCCNALARQGRRIFQGNDTHGARGPAQHRIDVARRRPGTGLQDEPLGVTKSRRRGQCSLPVESNEQPVAARPGTSVVGGMFIVALRSWHWSRA